jgi:ornithine cyclodeaminase
MLNLGYTLDNNCSQSSKIERNAYLAIPIIDAPIVQKVLANDIHFVKEQVQLAFKTIFEKVDTINQPAKFYLQSATSTNPIDRIIAMPFSIEGSDGISGIKWISSNQDNYLRGINRANAMLILNDIETRTPLCIMDDTTISSLRTVAVTLIVLERLCPTPKRVACIGMGKLGRMHAWILRIAFPSVEKIFCFSNNASFDDIIDDKIVKSSCWREALRQAEVIITTTSACNPYVYAKDINDNQLIINISLMDFALDVFQKAFIIVDDWFQCTQAQKVFKQGVDKGLFKREDIIELPDLLFGKSKDRTFQEGIVMVNLLGMSIEDIFVAKALYEKVMYWSNIKPNYFLLDNTMNPFHERHPRNKQSISVEQLVRENEQLKQRISSLEGQTLYSFILSRFWRVLFSISELHEREVIQKCHIL